MPVRRKWGALDTRAWKNGLKGQMKARWSEDGFQSSGRCPSAHLLLRESGSLGLKPCEQAKEKRICGGVSKKG